jgi:hypothetical protein
MLHKVQSLGPKRGLIGGKMASWLLTGFELVADIDMEHRPLMRNPHYYIVS